MFVDDNYRRIHVRLEDLIDLTDLTQKRREMAKKVLEDPSENNLIEYNYIVEIQNEKRSDLGIYPKLTEEEKAASTIWMARKDNIEWL